MKHDDQFWRSIQYALLSFQTARAMGNFLVPNSMMFAIHSNLEAGRGTSSTVGTRQDCGYMRNGNNNSWMYYKYAPGAALCGQAYAKGWANNEYTNYTSMTSIFAYDTVRNGRNQGTRPNSGIDDLYFQIVGHFSKGRPLARYNNGTAHTRSCRSYTITYMELGSPSVGTRHYRQTKIVYSVLGSPSTEYCS